MVCSLTDGLTITTTNFRVGGGEDPVGGMGEALLGLTKNEKIIIGVPTGEWL
jgi:hypothetical protein